MITSHQHLHHYHYHHHHNHYKTIFIIIIIIIVIVVVAIVITTVWNKNMLKKRWSICQIRWDAIIILFHTTTHRAFDHHMCQGKEV